MGGNDAASVRSVLLAVYKEDPVVRRIFEIIREAEVPEIHFSAHVNSASDLKKTENFTIKGSVEKGPVFAPKAELLVSNVSANVLIENGIRMQRATDPRRPVHTSPPPRAGPVTIRQISKATCQEKNKAGPDTDKSAE